MNNHEKSHSITSDLNKLITDIENVDAGLLFERVADKAILLLGETKAGKTTFLYYLLNKKLIWSYDEEMQVHQINHEALFLNAHIGNNCDSTTVYPNIPSEIPQDGVLIIDMPGFGDTRQLERLLNIYIIRQTIKKIKSVHVCLVISNQSLEGSNLQQALEQKCLLLKSQYLQDPKCLSFILTKVQDQELERNIFVESVRQLKQSYDQSALKMKKALDNFQNANIYVFESKQPIQQEGAQLKARIVSQNNFYVIDQLPEKLLSQRYADIIIGQDNWLKFEAFIGYILEGIQTNIVNLLKLFKLVVLYNYKDILGELSVQLDVQALAAQIIKITSLLEIREISSLDIHFKQRVYNKQKDILSLIIKFFPIKSADDNRCEFLQHLSNFVEWSRLLKQQNNSSLSLQLRNHLHLTFKYLTQILGTIAQINNVEIIKSFEKLMESQIKQCFEDYMSFPKQNQLPTKIKDDPDAYQLVYTNQDLKNILLTLQPTLIFQELDSTVIQKIVPISTLAKIKNHKLFKSLQETISFTKSKPKYKQDKQSSQLLSLQAGIEQNLCKIKNMGPKGSNIKSLLSAINSIKDKFPTKDQNRIKLAKSLIQKTASLLTVLTLIEQAVLFYLSCSTETQAQQLIAHGIYYGSFSQDYIKSVLIPYYFKTNPNIQMVQTLYNYLIVDESQHDRLFQHEKQYAQTLYEMHQSIKNDDVGLLRFQFKLIEAFLSGQGEQYLIQQCSEWQKRLNQSKLMTIWPSVDSNQ